MAAPYGGIALIENVPKHQQRGFEDYIPGRFHRKTHFGDDVTVMTKRETTTFAQTNSKLQLHIDIPYWDQMPSVDMLHCVTQSETGGGNTLADGFYAAELLRQQYPRHFDVLTRVKVNWNDYEIERGDEHVALLHLLFSKGWRFVAFAS